MKSKAYSGDHVGIGDAKKFCAGPTRPTAPGGM